MSETAESEAAAPPPLSLRDALADGLGDAFRLPRFGRRGFALVAAFVALGWALTAIYKVQPDEQGVVLRFGQWSRTTAPGLHLHWPYPIETVLLPKVTNVNEVALGEGGGVLGVAPTDRERQMLTGDENIVEADCSVFWRIRDAGRFLFAVAEPEAALRVEAEAALRDVVSRTPIQAAMSDRREQIAAETRALLQKALDAENAGIEIVAVRLERVEPPRAVIDAFNDVQRARADQERERNEAQAYANDVLPRARAEADRIRQDAEAYRASAVNIADGDARAFDALRRAYEDAPAVTGWRLYYDAVDETLKNAGRIVVDTSGKGVGSLTPYMPIPDAPAPGYDPQRYQRNGMPPRSPAPMGAPR